MAWCGSPEACCLGLSQERLCRKERCPVIALRLCIFKIVTVFLPRPHSPQAVPTNDRAGWGHQSWVILPDVGLL